MDEFRRHRHSWRGPPGARLPTCRVRVPADKEPALRPPRHLGAHACQQLLPHAGLQAPAPLDGCDRRWRRCPHVSEQRIHLESSHLGRSLRQVVEVAVEEGEQQRELVGERARLARPLRAQRRTQRSRPRPLQHRQSICRRVQVGCLGQFEPQAARERHHASRPGLRPDRRVGADADARDGLVRPQRRPPAQRKQVRAELHVPVRQRLELVQVGPVGPAGQGDGLGGGLHPGGGGTVPTQCVRRRRDADALKSALREGKSACDQSLEAHPLRARPAGKVGQCEGGSHRTGRAAHPSRPHRAGRAC
eukprot:scaffold294_cov131-Isochrysis_galbana.AAC.6